MRIVFMCPDANGPTGGVTIIHEIARALSDSGIEAVVWHHDPARAVWSPARQAKTVWGPTIALQPGDVLVVPEVGADRYAPPNSAFPVVVLNQGHYNTFGHASMAADVHGNYPYWTNAKAVIGTSVSITDFLSTLGLGIPCHLLKVWVEQPEVAPSVERCRAVAFMPRRRGETLRSLIGAIRRDPNFAEWDVRVIDHMTPAEVMTVLSTSEVFLHGADREGLGLPALEAMAAGAYVVGFTGDGGREFMRDDLCTLLDGDDLASSVRRFKDALAMAPDERRARASRARAMVAEEYSWEGFVRRCVEVFTSIPQEAQVSEVATASHLDHLVLSARRPNLRLRLGRARDAFLQ